ncbi:MAG: von Willebrand factor type A domain-containing protein, partial [Ruminococcus sp.]|nr:von Willebrand factor type A domain-containing protein [Ruminococcus sp.]
MLTSCGQNDDSSTAPKTSAKTTTTTTASKRETTTTTKEVKQTEASEIMTEDVEETNGDTSLYSDRVMFFNDATTKGAAADGVYMAEEYSEYTDNDFKNVSDEPVSTFSTDVDTASFTRVRRMIHDSLSIDGEAVRTEEFVNYFKYDYPQPQGDDKVAINTELSDCPWNSNARILRIGLQAKEAEVKDIDSNIVFLIDVSGSMLGEDRLGLVQKAFAMLAENLGQNDRVSIVTYAGDDAVVLQGTSGADKDKIIKALNSLEAGGSTAGAKGINTAYELAEKNFIEGGNNRVILATDGDLNVGISSVEELTDLITDKKESGIFLSVLGFGIGNYKDNRLEALADNGNGNYAYIDSLDEAERVLVTEMNGTMFTVAKDTKVQVEFSENCVKRYKLIGYENRMLQTEDFEDDTKDAGDIGSGQQVTALYELILNDAPENDMLKVSVRYKEADEDVSKLIEKEVKNDEYVELSKISDN